jgi:predicted peptidase
MGRSFRCFVLVLTVSSAADRAVAANPAEFQVFSLTSGTSTLLPGRIYAPPAASMSPRPLILFLHGAGESGTNNTLQVNGNIDNLLAEAKRRDAFLYAPQTNATWAGATTTDRVMSMIDRALGEFNVDASRLYVTGLSMGGGGTWNILNRYGERFAAGVPICAVSPATDFNPANLLDESIWAFHARTDGTVSVTTSRNVVNRIRAAGGEAPWTFPTNADPLEPEFTSPTIDLKYTDYRLGGHGIWGRVYNTPAMYEWMFARTTVPEPTGLILAGVFAIVATVGRRRP